MFRRNKFALIAALIICIGLAAMEFSRQTEAPVAQTAASQPISKNEGITEAAKKYDREARESFYKVLKAKYKVSEAEAFTEEKYQVLKKRCLDEIDEKISKSKGDTYILLEYIRRRVENDGREPNIKNLNLLRFES